MAEIYNDKSYTLVLGTSDNDSIDNEVGNVTIDAGAGNDSIENWRGDRVSIDGGAGNDYIYNTPEEDGGGCTGSCGGDDVVSSDSVTIDGGDGDDSIDNDGGNYASIVGGAGNDSIKNYGDKVTIGGGDGNDYIDNHGDSVKIVGGADNDYIENDGNKVTISGGDGDDSVKNYGGRVSIVGGAGNDSIKNYGDKVTIGGGDGNDYIDNHGDSVKIGGCTGDDYIENHGSNVTLNGGAGSDSIFSNCSKSDGIIHYDVGKYGYGSNVLFQYTKGDGNDVIYGFGKTDTLSIGGGSYSTTKSGNDLIITVGTEKISLIGAVSLDKINIDGEEATQDSALLSLDNKSKSSVTLGADITVADATSRTKAIKIVGNKLANSISGGSGNDTLNGGKGNDTLSGGNGDDLFVYTAGNDVITDYTEDFDKISISAAISKSSIKGSDATFTIGKNTLTVKNGFGKEIVFIDAKGKERTIIGGAYIADNSSSSKSTLGSWREVGDASERTKAIKLTGNALDNSILGGSGKDSLYGADGNDYLVGNAGADKLYGQNGNDTLWGGMGSDTLIGGDGADVFIYESGDGKDVISGFENNDMLLITGAFSASYDAKKNSIAFKVDSTANAITIKDFTATKFNINGINYKISSSKLVKK